MKRIVRYNILAKTLSLYEFSNSLTKILPRPFLKGRGQILLTNVMSFYKILVRDYLYCTKINPHPAKTKARTSLSFSNHLPARAWRWNFRGYQRVTKPALAMTILLFSQMTFAQVDMEDVVGSNEGEPINITSENLVIKNREELSIFENNVKVVQGTMVLKANKVKVYSETDATSKKSRFKQIEATGNVDFVSGKHTAKSEVATYDVKAGILKLRDNVRLTDTDTTLQGRVFEYNVKTGVSKISNSGGAVSADKAGVKAKDGETPAGRAKVTFTPGEGIETMGVPMDPWQGKKA
jgi:lipopolysaccharide export system protein LptA